jgi:tetratricopeptide (TPR) repeat protein
MSRDAGDEAAAHFSEALRIAAGLGERVSEGRAHQFLAELANSRDEFALADSEFETALALYTGADAHEPLVECHVAYARALRARGDTERALVHFEAAVASSRPHLSQPSEIRYLMVG